MSNPTRFTSGVATVPSAQPLGNYPFPDPFHTSGSANLDTFTYWTDYTEAGQVASNTVTGASSTFSLTNGVGGMAILTPGGTTTASSAYRTYSAFQFVAGQQFWYLQRIQPSAVAGNVSFKFGLQYGSATTDGIWFTKPAASTTLSLVSSVGSTATTLVSSVMTGLTAGGWIDVAFYYNGTDLLVYTSDTLVARVANVTIGASGTTLTNVLLTPFIQITPVATDTLTSDYVFAAQETTR
jgi:hypothetical protein